jgi:hypothetical protein
MALSSLTPSLRPSVPSMALCPLYGSLPPLRPSLPLWLCPFTPLSLLNTLYLLQSTRKTQWPVSGQMCVWSMGWGGWGGGVKLENWQQFCSVLLSNSGNWNSTGKHVFPLVICKQWCYFAKLVLTKRLVSLNSERSKSVLLFYEVAKCVLRTVS